MEESITNWLFGFNVYMTVMLEKKTELAGSLIFHANRILKAHQEGQGSAWLEYDRDFRWAKVDDPDIGWDQVEVSAWLDSVQFRGGGRQHSFRPQGGDSFRQQYAGGDRKGTCWAFNKKVCMRRPCRFKHVCSFCGHHPHPESKCNKRPAGKEKESS